MAPMPIRATAPPHLIASAPCLEYLPRSISSTLKLKGFRRKISQLTGATKLGQLQISDAGGRFTTTGEVRRSCHPVVSDFDGAVAAGRNPHADKSVIKRSALFVDEHLT